MNYQTYNSIVSFIWGIADDCLRDVYVRGKYRDVILPMTVIRRLDAVLEPTKEAVLKMKAQLDKAKITNQTQALCQASGQAFYNASPFTLKDLKARAKQQQLRADFEAYLDGFSPNVQEILCKFKFRNQLQTLIDADVLGSVIEKFLDASINLSSEPVLDGQGNVKFPALDNHAMGTVFEELIRRFNEENNEEAGEHFTPRDVIELMANLIFYPIADKIKSGTYLIYDGACGTGGMLTIAEEKLQALAEEHGKEVAIHLYGQEINHETYAIAKADMLLKGEGEEAENIHFGSTLSNDGFPTQSFDFMLSNPPYGKSWKTDLERMGGKSDIKDTRFVVSHAGEAEYKMIPRSSDGQMLFLADKISKIKQNTELGSRICEVHNGSSLFTGDAGQGESNIRRYIIENDWLEAIVALPENMFYNTGIATFIWVLSNRKPANRLGKVQLIDATGWKSPLRKNLGNKNCEFSTEIIEQITKTFLEFEGTEQSKIFRNEEFGYYKITVERPLRLSIRLSEEKCRQFEKQCIKEKETELTALINALAIRFDRVKQTNYNIFLDMLNNLANEMGVKLNAKKMNFIKNHLAEIDESAQPVVRKIHKPDKIGANPLLGLYEDIINGKKCLVEYEPDTDLRDTEQIPLLEKGGIEAFFNREVLSFAPDAWIVEDKTLVGYEINFTKYFYKPAQMRTLDEIKAELLSLEAETDGLLREIIGGQG
jgi:type I restriction enzyme M protein